MRPTAKQLAYLKKLAVARGVTFVYPPTRAAASREIGRLLAYPLEHRELRVHEAREIAREVAERPNDASAVREHEITGYGAHATWR